MHRHAVHEGARGLASALAHAAEGRASASASAADCGDAAVWQGMHAVAIGRAAGRPAAFYPPRTMAPMRQINGRSVRRQ